MVRLATLLAILILTGCTLAQQGAFNLESYGKTTPATLVGDGVTDDTAAVQALIDAAFTAGGGTVNLPAGTFAVTGLAMSWTGKSTINLVGSGERATFFKKIGTSSAPIIDQVSALSAIETYSTVSDLTLLGNERCSVGLRMTTCARFRLENISVFDCSVGIDVCGSLIGKMDEVTCKNNDIGMRFRASGGLHPNLIPIKGGSLQGNSLWGIDYGDGSGLSLESVDIERNGTTENPDTGGVILRDTCDNECGYATIMLTMCWFEGNNGTAFKAEWTPGLTLALRSCNILSTEAGRAISVALCRSITLSECTSGGTGDTWSIRSGHSFINGGVVYALTDISDVKTYTLLTTHGGDVTNIVREP